MEHPAYPSSSQGRKVATVFGGSGFLGRYVVKRLAAAGYVVRVAVRDTEGAMFLRPMGGVGQIVPLQATVTSDAGVARAVEGASVVINLVGILAERHRGDFTRLQEEGAGRVARASAAAGVAHLVQLSAIGADAASASLYASSKAKGEVAVLAAFPSATILRPSLVFGAEDGFFNRFAAIALISPIMPVISGSTRFQPVYVGDVADAVMAAIATPAASGQTYELGGPDVKTFRELISWVLELTGRKRMMVNIPDSVAQIQARIMEHIPGKPLTRDQLILLARDNVTTTLPGLAELGVTPTPMDQIVPGYLARYRSGGAPRPG
jgi:uncharacterized protein YbjT (DUF2867 family)